jgi:hypothetical protein
VDADERMISVLFRMPFALKIRMGHYCVDNRIKQQELIIQAIEQLLRNE